MKLNIWLQRERSIGALTGAAALCALALGACGSNSSSKSSSAASTGGATSTGSSAAKGPASYNGPAASLPASYATPKKASQPVKIGYLQITNAQPSLAMEQQGAVKRAGELGAQLIVKDAELNPGTQVAQFQQLLAQGVKAIIVYPVVPQSLQPALAAAAKAGVKVIGDSARPDVSQALPQGLASDLEEPNDLASYEMAKAGAQQPGAHVGIIGTALPIAVLKYLTSREQYWAGQFGLTVDGEADVKLDTPTGYATAVNQLLSDHPDLQQIWTYDELQALTAANIVKSSGRKIGVYTTNVTGDKAGTNAIESRGITMAYQGHWTDQGAQMLNAAYNAATGQNLPLPKTVIIPGTVVTKANASAVAQP